MEKHLFLSVIAGISIGSAAGFLGSLMLTRRMALVAGPLGHLTLPGIALAMIYGFDLALGAFPFVILGISAIWWLEMRSGLPVEALTAIVFASGVAITFLLLPIEQTETALVGDITRVGPMEAAFTATVAVILCIIVRKIFKVLVLMTAAEELAQAEGIDVRTYNLVYLLLIAVIIALGVKIVGGLLTAALVAIPAAAARNFTSTLSQYAYTALIIGGGSSLVGVLISRFLSLPAGPVIILVSTLIFLVTLFHKRMAARTG